MVDFVLFISLTCIIGRCSSDGIEYPSLGTLKFAVFINSSSVKSCSGTILSPTWVLTAASCVKDNADVHVYAGTLDYNNSDNSTQKRKGMQLIVHPNYQEGLAGHDLALIQVVDFKFGSTVGRVKIAGEQWQGGDNDDIQCISFGYGGTSLDKPESNTKLKMWKSKASYGDKECLCTKRFQWRRMLCTKRVKGQGLCGQGDFGSGLICYHGVDPFSTANNSTELFGVAHKMWNINSCKSKRDFLYKVACDDMETVSTYMYLCPYMDWISQYVEDCPTKPPSCGAGAISPRSVVLIIFFVIVA